MRVFFAVFTVFCVLFGLGVVLDQFVLERNKLFAPQYEKLRNDVYHQSQAYTDGMINQLAKDKYGFDTTSDHDEKSKICALVRADYGRANPADFRPELANFIITCNTWK